MLDTSQPKQVWAGPLAGGDVVVLLLNTGNTTATIAAEWDDVGLYGYASAMATDLWSGEVVGKMAGKISHQSGHP
jgi:alpha-galactosidase